MPKRKKRKNLYPMSAFDKMLWKKSLKRLFSPVCADPYCKERKYCKHGRRMV